MKKLLYLFFVVMLFFSIAAAAPAQLANQHSDQQPQDPMDIKRQKEMQKNLNTQRVKEIKQDTDKLLDLANQLKKSVDAASENTLSMDVIRKTEEIEKLAKKVRGKMKETYEPPVPSSPPDSTTR